MCGRFTIMLEADELREQLDLGELPPEFTTNTNIKPGEFVPVVTEPENRNVELYHWGLVPSWAKDIKVGYKMFNARAETINVKPSFRIPFLRRRCLILADGFYEWRQDGAKKNPYLFTLKDRQAFTFAGLWDIWHDLKGNELRSCTIITTEPNSLLVQYHDRMPVILDESTRWKWLMDTPPAELLSLLKPIPSDEMREPLKIDRLG